MSKDNFKEVDLRTARNNVESMRIKKKRETNAKIENVEKQTRFFSSIEVTKPPSDQYRDNYAKVFGHD